MVIEVAPLVEILGGRLTVDPSELLRRSRATDQDVVVLSGTLLEGYGNLYSDLDLYVIGERLPSKVPDLPNRRIIGEDGRVRRVNDVLTNCADILLDVQYYTFRELDSIARSLNALYQESMQSTRTFRRTLHHEDEDLIHKLLTGKVLQNSDTGFDARRTFDPETFCFLKYRNEVGGYPEFRDLVGSWTSGDLDTCLYNTRAYLISQVSGMMFLAGNTNPRPKWFVRRLGSLDAAYSGLRDGVMFWMYNARRTDSQKRAAVEEACALIDETYSHARRLLGTSKNYFSLEQAIEMTDREFEERSARDRDSLAEWHLSRGMFSDSPPSLFEQIGTQSRVACGPEASYG